VRKLIYGLIIMIPIFLCVFLSNCGLPTKKVVEEQVPLIPKHVLIGHPEKSFVRISPDGKKLAYLAPRNRVPNIWVKTLGQNDDHSITSDTKRGIRDFVWAKNNKHILFVQDKEGDEKFHIYKTDLKTLETIDLTPFKNIVARINNLNKNFSDEILITMNKENKKLFDVYRLNLISGKLDLEAKNPGNVDFWLADSNFVVRAAVTAKSDGSSDLLLRDDKNSEWQKKLKWDFEDSLVGSVPPGGSRPISFSRDGKFLYLIDSSGANTKRLVKMSFATDDKEVLSFDDNYDIDKVLLNQNTHEPELVSFYRDRMEWQALRPNLKSDLELVLSLNKGELNHIHRNLDGTKWILYFISDTGPGTYYLFDRKTKKADFLFYDKPALNKYKLASMKPVSFKSRDGLIIHGYLTCPVGKPAKNLPMVLDVHGGPWWRHKWGYFLTGGHNATAQVLANWGYACLHVNYRGSSGYGKKFLNAGDREWGGKMHDDLIDAVNWAVKEGIADPDRIAIMGESGGGYAALVGATFTPDVFRCAISMYGPTNLVTLVKSIVDFRPMGKAKWYRRVGHPVKDKAFLESRSPLFKVDQIKIPILIAQGGNDPRVKPSEAEQIVEAMKAKGIEYEYLFFPNEGHGITRPENRFKLAVAVEKFLAKHLKGK
jgi:dipeptidyl aminopeptidase/acylaminoacyl peptidase